MSEPEKIKKLFAALLKSESFYFPEKGKLDITCEHGVYIILDTKQQVVHVGNTTRGEKGLCQRLNNHIGGSSSFSKNYLKPKQLSIRDGFIYKLLEVPNARERSILQAFTIGTLCPKHIGTGEKK